MVVESSAIISSGRQTSRISVGLPTTLVGKVVTAGASLPLGCQVIVYTEQDMGNAGLSPIMITVTRTSPSVLVSSTRVIDRLECQMAVVKANANVVEAELVRRFVRCRAQRLGNYLGWSLGKSKAGRRLSPTESSAVVKCRGVPWGLDPARHHAFPTLR